MACGVLAWNVLLQRGGRKFLYALRGTVLEIQLTHRIGSGINNCRHHLYSLLQVGVSEGHRDLPNLVYYSSQSDPVWHTCSAANLRLPEVYPPTIHQPRFFTCLHTVIVISIWPLCRWFIYRLRLFTFGLLCYWVTFGLDHFCSFSWISNIILTSDFRQFTFGVFFLLGQVWPLPLLFF